MSAAVLAAIQDLAERITRLERAARQPERRAFKRSEVAAMLGVDVKTVTGWIGSGRLKAVSGGAFYIIPAVELDRFLSAEQALAS